MHQRLRGTGVALVTPFNENGAIDYTGLKKVVEYTITNKVEYLVTLGTTGESVTLSKQEKDKILEFTVETVKGRVPLVAGFGGNNTHEVIKSIKEFHFNGVDAILSVSPYYNKPTQEGIFRHYKAIAEASPVPVILYNIPGRTASNITAETTLRLAHEFRNIIGIKEASGDLQQSMTIIQNRPEGFLVMSGDDALTLPMISIGADGVISVIANAFPRDFSDMARSALLGNFTEAQRLHYKLYEIMRLLFAEGNPAGVKCALKHLNVCDPYVRLPLVSASKNLTDQLNREMDKVIFSEKKKSFDFV